MFTIRAGYSDDIELRSSADKVREFFADIRNFAELMPGIQQIHTDAKGVAHWKIQAEIPFVGQMLQNFAVELAENSKERIEWSPIKTEAQNFLRYSAEFIEKAKNLTVVRFSQMVELRRKSGRELHYLAGLAGETLISNEMAKRIAEMIKVFIDRAKERLEGKS
jgi:carbon monoxide dehydrogenase subunit G